MRPVYLLYNTLCVNIASKKLTKKQKLFLVEKVNNLDNNKLVAVILLIYEHALRNNDIKYEEGPKYPYKDYSVDSLPQDLQHIIHKFVNFES